MLYANSSQDLLLRPAEGAKGQADPRARVFTLRVNAKSGAASLVPLPTGEDSACTVVWAENRGHLFVGEIDPEAKLRCRTCNLVDTPIAAAYHEVRAKAGLREPCVLSPPLLRASKRTRALR